MADPAVSLMVREVKRSISRGEEIISGVELKLENLINRVRYIQKYLPTAAMEEQRKENFERQLQRVLYTVVDNIESSASLMAAAIDNYTFFSVPRIPSLAKILEGEIDSIVHDTLDPIAHQIQVYGTQQTYSTQTSQVPSEPVQKKVLPSEPTKVVGLEKEVKILKEYLKVETEPSMSMDKVDVIAITGMPGIGKTTLASKIFHDENIGKMFPTRIWVDNFSHLKELCMEILKQCKDTGADIPQESCSKDSSTRILNDFSHLDDDALKQTVKKSLKKSKYLLVMDDVRDAGLLKMVKDMLPPMGKVLITTRSNHFAPYCHYMHQLGLMNEEESWELLKLKVFGELDDCPKNLESIGKNIAENCGGLPLAIAAIGGSLVVSASDEQLTEEWWLVVSKNVTVYVTDYDSQHRVLQCIEISYNSMDQRLQECFLYLGVFPEGHEIHVGALVHLWIAEGFVNSMRLSLYKSAKYILGETTDSELPNLESEANKYLDDLISRNLVLVSQRYSDGRIKTCRLHSVIYAFCQKKASGKHIYQEIKMSRDGPFALAPNSRLCIYSVSGLSSFLSSQPNEPSVRSILLYFKENEKAVLSHEESSRIPKLFKLLRVLDCRHVNFTRFPDRLNELIHLRYISLCCEEIRVIPKTIATLRYLETLVVYTESSSLRLQANIYRMIQLRHLVTKAAIVLATPGAGEDEKANYLKTLTRLAPACCSQAVFKGTPNLETLGIRGHLNTLPERECLQKLTSLQNLKLINEPAVAWSLNMDFPEYLTRLTLSGTRLEWICMSTLGKISSLEIIKLKNNAFTGESWTSTRADGFDRVKFLLIDTTDLLSWDASADCFPTLKHLVFRNCFKVDVPSSLAERLNKLEYTHVVESASEFQE